MVKENERKVETRLIVHEKMIHEDFFFGWEIQYRRHLFTKSGRVPKEIEEGWASKGKGHGSGYSSDNCSRTC